MILYTTFSHPPHAHKVLICAVVVGLSDSIYYGLSHPTCSQGVDLWGGRCIVLKVSGSRGRRVTSVIG
jgi:hypothetical protein